MTSIVDNHVIDLDHVQDTTPHGTTSTSEGLDEAFSRPLTEHGIQIPVKDSKKHGLGR